MKRGALGSESIFLRVPKPLNDWLLGQVGKLPGASNRQAVIVILLDRERLKQ